MFVQRSEQSFKNVHANRVLQSVSILNVYILTTYIYIYIYITRLKCYVIIENALMIALV